MIFVKRVATVASVEGSVLVGLIRWREAGGGRRRKEEGGGGRRREEEE